MMQIEKLNEILKKNISLDIFDNNDSYKNELSKRVSEKIDKQLSCELSLEDAIKVIYGKDTEIIIKEDVICKTPSNLENLKPNPDRILNLSDLGYKTVQINYYVKQPNTDKLIYIAANKNNVKKYNEVLTEIGFMNKLEQEFNITLNPNIEHVDVVDGKRFLYFDEYGDVMYRYTLCNVIDIVENNKSIRKEDGTIIAKNIDCTNFDGYSSDHFRSDKVQLDFNLKQNSLKCELKNIPDNVLVELKNVAKKYIYNNYADIINNVIEAIKEYINDYTKNLTTKLYNALHSIYFYYPNIISYSEEANISLPKINSCDFKNFNARMVETKNSLFPPYQEKLNQINSKLEEISINKEENNNKLEKILSKSNNLWENFSYHPTNIFGFDEDCDCNIRIGSSMENTYCDFKSLIEGESASIDYAVEKLRRQIQALKEEIEFGRSFDKIYTYDYDLVREEQLPFDDAETLVCYIEQNLEGIKNLINEINRLNEQKKELNNKLYLVEDDYESKINIYNKLIYNSNKINEDFSILLDSSKYIVEFCSFLDEIASIISFEFKNEEEYKKLCFYKGLFDSIISGNIFNNDLKQNDKYNDFLATERPKYFDEDYVGIIKKQIKSAKQ